MGKTRKSKKKSYKSHKKYKVRSTKRCKKVTNAFGLGIYKKKNKTYKFKRCCNWKDRSLFGKCYGVKSELGAIAAPYKGVYNLIK